MRLANATICHTTVDGALLLPHRTAPLYTSGYKQREGKREERKKGRKKTGGLFCPCKTNKFLHRFERKQKAHRHRSSRIHPDILHQHLTSVASGSIARPLEENSRSQSGSLHNPTVSISHQTQIS